MIFFVNVRYFLIIIISRAKTFDTDLFKSYGAPHIEEKTTNDFFNKGTFYKLFINANLNKN